MTKTQLQAIKYNAQHIAGMAVGLVLRPLGLRFGKEHRGAFWFSTVAANLVADGQPVELFPYAVFSRRRGS